MPKPISVGVVQMRSTPDPWENLALVLDFVAEAIQSKLNVLCFPENVFFRGPRSAPLRPGAVLGPSLDSALGQALLELSQKLSEHRLVVLLGSVLWNEGGGKPYNASLVLGAEVPFPIYRKIHLFDFQGSQAAYQESREVLAGDQTVCVDLHDWKWGLSICYDLRFPELYRDLVFNKGAQILHVPAAFTRETGRKHWLCLLRARAIENQSYVVAPAQWGTHSDSSGRRLACFGHSVVFDPWGECLALAPATQDALLKVELFPESVSAARARLPALHSIKLLAETSLSS